MVRQIYMSRRLHIISWLVGVAALAAVVLYFRPENFLSSLRTVGATGAAGWLAATLIARVLFAEVPARLLRTLGFDLGRLRIFLIGWLRTFSNQILPMSGIAVYIQQIRSQSGATLQDLAASSTQQAFIGISAMGAVGCVAMLSNLGALGDVAWPLIAVFAALSAIALAAAVGASAVIGRLPRLVAKRITTAADSFERLASNRKLIYSLVATHSTAILVRGARIWLLFGVLGASLHWREALLVVALAEVTVLIAVTPGGLGIREAIIIGGASLLDVPTDIAVAVSLIDRLFVVVLAGSIAVPSVLHLLRIPGRQTDK